MDDAEQRRHRMVRRIKAAMASMHPRLDCHLSPETEAALLTVPRHLFVSPSQQAAAYDDSALPIAGGQTISQPLIVALMTELLRSHPGQRILEVGTGSGYQTAILAQLVESVHSVEIRPDLAAEAERRLRAAGYDNVALKSGDGRLGWIEAAPFDGIIVTAAPPDLPLALSAQLKPGGRLVIPLGRHDWAQELWAFDKDLEGKIKGKPVLPVRFVPLI